MDTEANRILFLSASSNNDLKRMRDRLMLGLSQAKKEGNTPLADKFREEISYISVAANQRRLAGTWS